MKKTLLIFGLIILAQTSFAQTQFLFRYGSVFHDDAKKVIQTYDGNYIVVGQTNGFGSGNNAFIMKVSENGTILWLKDYSGVNDDIIFDVIELPDSSLIMCGSTGSYGAGYADAFIMKTDSIGNIQWAKTYGNIWSQEFYKISKDEENGFYVSGLAYNVNNDLGSTVIRLNSEGVIQWAKWVLTPSLSAVDIGMTVIRKGGVALSSSEGNNQTRSCWKFSSSGNLDWSKLFTPTPLFSGLTGGLILENNTDEILFNFSVANSNTVANASDNCMLKLDSLGNIMWFKSYGGTFFEEASNFSNTPEGGIIVSGITNSVGNGGLDSYLMKLTTNGALEWAAVYGTEWDEGSKNVIRTTDNGFILCGKTNPFGFSNDSSKVYLVKTDLLGNSTCNNISWTPITNNQTVAVTSPGTPVNITFQVTNFTFAIHNRYFYTYNFCLPISVNPTLATTDNLNIYPNPFTSQTILRTDKVLKDATLTLYNALGQQVRQVNNISGQTLTLHRDNLTSGLYYLQLTQDNQTIATDKLVITD